MDVITGQTSIVINAPRDVVYGYLADFRKHPQWVKNVYRLTPVRVTANGVGSSFRTLEFTPPTSPRRAIAATLQFMRGMLGGVASMSTCEITALEPPHRIAWVGYLPKGQQSVFNRAEWEFVLVPRGSGTELTQRFRYVPQTTGARRMLAALGDGDGIAQSCAVSLATLKTILERQYAVIMA